MRKTWVIGALAAAAVALACDGGGRASDDSSDQPTESTTSYIIDPCGKRDTDAALAAPATDHCETTPDPSEESS